MEVVRHPVERDMEKDLNVFVLTLPAKSVKVRKCA